MSAPKTVHIAFHSVLIPREPGFNHPLTCSVDRLRAIVEHLLDKSYTIITCGEYAAKRKEEMLPPKVVTLSFDDGYADNARCARILSDEFGVGCTLFIIGCTLQGFLPPNAVLVRALRDLGTSQVLSVFERMYGKKSIWVEQMKDKSIIGPFIEDFDHAVAAIKAVFAYHLPLDERWEVARWLKREMGMTRGVEGEIVEKQYLTVDRLEMLDDVVEIASHSFSHAGIETRPLTEVREELEFPYMKNIKVSRKIFAYPHGLLGRRRELKRFLEHEKVVGFGYLARVPEDGGWGFNDPYNPRRADHRLFEAVMGLKHGWYEEE